MIAVFGTKIRSGIAKIAGVFNRRAMILLPRDHKFRQPDYGHR